MSPARRGSAACPRAPAMALEERHGIGKAQNPGSPGPPSCRAPLPPHPLVSCNMNCWTQNWATAGSQKWKKDLISKDERTTSNAPKGNCLVLVIYIAGLLANADARLQYIWTGWCICSGSWCEMRDLSRLLVEEGKAWDGQRKWVFEIRHGLHWRRIISFEELFTTLTYPQTVKSESKEGLEPGLSIRGEQNSRGGSGFAKHAQLPFDFANLNHKLLRARTAWIQAHKAGRSLEKLPILAHLQFKLTPGRWGGVQINIRNRSLMGECHFFQWTKVIFLGSLLHCISQTELKIAVKKIKKQGSPNTAAMNKIHY